MRKPRGPDAEVAPVAQGGDGHADDLGDLRDGEHLVVRVLELGLVCAAHGSLSF